jgi:predicted transcriptional regulator
MTVTDAFDDFPTSSTLLVTVQSNEEFYEESREAIERLQRGEAIEEPDSFSFPTVDLLFETFNSQTMQLLETIAEEGPDSIRETARLVDRDVKNVHQELTELERLGLIQFEQDGRAKRPIFPYDQVMISLPFDRKDATDAAPASS